MALLVRRSLLLSGRGMLGSYKPSYNKPTLWDWDAESDDDNEEASYTSKEMPWYDRKPSSSKTPPSYEPEVTVQGWVTQPNEISHTSEEELSDSGSITTDNEASDEKSINSNSTYVINPAAQETKRRMEATLPNSLRWLLGWPEVPSTPTTESTDLRDTIQALL